MRALVLFMLCVLVLSSAAGASVSLRFGKNYFHGDLYEGCKSKPPATNLFGLAVHLRSFPLLNIGFGGEYSSMDFVVDCRNQGFASSLKHYSVSADASLDILPFDVVKFYVGGGLSYDWFKKSGVPDQEGTDSSAGIQVLTGAASTLPGPVNGYIEIRYRWLGGGVRVNTSSAYLGLELG